MDEVSGRTEFGTVRGAVREGVASFLGIPYAAAPAGASRFAAPLPPERWQGVRDCLVFGPAAPQLAPAPGVPASWRPGDGPDCATLNIWTPDPGTTGLPVMVWIHGGFWKYGATSMPHYDGAILAASGVVVVTVNYRLGFEGFAHLPGAPDNRGLLDQIAALHWVRRNIHGFGGDPDRVTVFGQSAGAASIAHLLGTPAAAGLFRRAIAQSIPAGVFSRTDAERTTTAVAAAAGVPPTVEGFAALPPEAILAAQHTVPGRGGRGAEFGPVIDDIVVTGPPHRALATGAGREVDLICGYTRHEYIGHGPPTLPADFDLNTAATAVGLDAAEVSAYRKSLPGQTDAEIFTTLMSDLLVRVPTTAVAEAHTEAGGATWLYEFARPGPTGAAHGIDIPYVFGVPDTRYALRLLGSPPHPGFAELSRHIRRSWTNFAADGDPGWARFDLRDRTARIWDDTPYEAPIPVAPLGTSPA